MLHPGTGDAYADHIDPAGWLGSVLPLRMKVMAALLKGTTGRDAGLIATTQNVAA